jgi:hypothetical protein
MTLDLSHRDVLEALIGKRYLCGDDGTVLPTRQGLCPSCAGHVEPFDAHRRDVVGRLWSELQAM